VSVGGFVLDCVWWDRGAALGLGIRRPLWRGANVALIRWGRAGGA